AIKSDPRDYRNHVLLGQMLRDASQRDGVADDVRRNQLKEAEQELRRAIGLNQDAPDARVALAQFLASQKDRAGDAEAASREREAKLQKAELKDIPALRGLASLELRASRIDEAEKYLRLIAQAKDNAPLDAAWAQRVLGQILVANRDNPKNAREALK